MSKPYRTTTNSSKSNSNKKVFAIIIAVLVIAAAAYFGVAYAKKDMWPFKDAGTSIPSESKNSDSIIKDVSVTNDKKNSKVKILSVKVGVAKKEKATCTMTLSNKGLSMTLKDSAKSAKDPTGCTGWSLDATKLPKGEYKVKVDFKGKTHSETATSSVTL